MREAPSTMIIKELVARGAVISAYDPVIKKALVFGRGRAILCYYQGRMCVGIRCNLARYRMVRVYRGRLG